jgi:proton-translocating NADH-quinone oxidoreductase chain M|uniref:NADH-ubiquinone oxidoreductase chain 4 n=1 Tax=Baffinella frigidus TaxID=2571260 RepID=A0A6C0X727_9CRYP|nr:NADH dehydrogenase subunit 4 [Cryptophyta sp. CCMP2293]
MFNAILSWLILIPLVGILIIFGICKLKINLIKFVAFTISLITFVLSLFLFIFFDNSTSKFQFLEYFEWLPWANLHVFIGVDGISLFFILLSTFLVFICILTSWSTVNAYEKEHYICFLLILIFLIFVFSVLDILAFYIFFESILIPMYLIIGTWGSRTRKIKAAYQFFLYTLVGSVLMLLAIFFIYFETGTTDIQLLLSVNFSEKKQFILWLAFFASFAVKVPMVPFHIWLPEAHVEAPTSGSVILAGILLKMGTYGFLRFSLPLFPVACVYFSPFVYLLSVVAVIYTSCTTLRQVDLKKIIAYSSVAHMGFVTIGIFSGNIFGIEGSLIIMLSHGFISSGLFLCVGVLYDRHHTRLIKYYVGIVQVMPVYGCFFIFFSVANLGFPSTSSFCGEFLTLVGAFESNTVITTLASLGMILSAAYSLWLCNRVLFGQLHVKHIIQYSDLNKREICLLFPLVFCTLWLGIYPEIFLDTMHVSVANILENM